MPYLSLDIGAAWSGIWMTVGGWILVSVAVALTIIGVGVLYRVVSGVE